MTTPRSDARTPAPECGRFAFCEGSKARAGVLTSSGRPVCGRGGNWECVEPTQPATLDTVTIGAANLAA